MWIVSLSDGVRIVARYGPMKDSAEAHAFARFLSAEVDPAAVEEIPEADTDGLRSPVMEMVGWYDTRGGAL